MSDWWTSFKFAEELYLISVTEWYGFNLQILGGNIFIIEHDVSDFYVFFQTISLQIEGKFVKSR